MLTMFSTLLSEFYRTAECHPPDACGKELLRLLRHATAARAVLFGEGTACADAALPVEQCIADDCHAALAAAFAAGARAGRLPAAASADLPLGFEAGRCASASALRGSDLLRRQLHAAGFDELLLLSTLAAPGRHQVWLALLGAPGRGFTAQDGVFVAALCPHLLRALNLSRRTALDACIAQHSRVGHALLGPHYEITAFDAAFREMFAREWPKRPLHSLPPGPLEGLLRSGRFEARTATLELSGRGDRSLCLMTAPAQVGLLTPAERKVAAEYARGRSSKEIAQGLAVSDNTVRTHLAHIFDKLGIHRKADLIRRLASG